MDTRLPKVILDSAYRGCHIVVLREPENRADGRPRYWWTTTGTVAWLVPAGPVLPLLVVGLFVLARTIKLAYNPHRVAVAPLPTRAIVGTPAFWRNNQRELHPLCR